MQLSWSSGQSCILLVPIYIWDSIAGCELEVLPAGRVQALTSVPQKSIYRYSSIKKCIILGLAPQRVLAQGPSSMVNVHHGKSIRQIRHFQLWYRNSIPEGNTLNSTAPLHDPCWPLSVKSKAITLKKFPNTCHCAFDTFPYLTQWLDQIGNSRGTSF